MNRRDTILALLSLGASPFAVEAQPARHVPTIGFLYPGSIESNLPLHEFFKQLRDLVWIEGQNMPPR